MATLTNMYPTLNAFIDKVKATPEFNFYIRRSEFYGASSVVEACEYVTRGASAAEQAPAKALIDKIDASTHGRKKVQAMPSVAGERVNIGAYLRGEPQNMRRRVRVEHDRAPIRLVVEVVVSASVTEAQLVNRGAAIAALAMRLSECRPVELWASWCAMPNDKDTVCGMVRLDTAPISIAQVVAVTMSRQFSRGVVFNEYFRMGKCSTASGLPWGWNLKANAVARSIKCREALQLEPQDIFIPGGHIAESDAWMTDPVAWVNSYLDSQREAE